MTILLPHVRHNPYTLQPASFAQIGATETRLWRRTGLYLILAPNWSTGPSDVSLVEQLFLPYSGFLSGDEFTRFEKTPLNCLCGRFLALNWCKNLRKKGTVSPASLVFVR